MWIFVMESFKFPIIVLIKEPSHDVFFKNIENMQIGMLNS